MLKSLLLVNLKVSLTIDSHIPVCEPIRLLLEKQIIMANKSRLVLLLVMIVAGFLLYVVQQPLQLGYFRRKFPVSKAFISNPLPVPVVEQTKSSWEMDEGNLPLQKLKPDKQQNQVEPMAFALNCWEQQGSAINNLFDLQCWAHEAGITKVLEPHVVAADRVFSFRPEHQVRFRDLLKIDAWNSMSLSNSASPLVPLEMFLKYSVKKLVYVEVIHGWGHCQSMDVMKKEDWYRFLTQKGFSIVQEVCMNFNRKNPDHGTATAEEFRNRIFEKTGRNVSVVFREWRGIRDCTDASIQRECNFRNPINGSHCSALMYKMAGVELVSSPPTRVKYLHDARSSPIVLNSRLSGYVDQFKTEFMSQVDYMAVMLRTEKLKHKFNIVKSKGNSSDCLDRIVSDIDEITVSMAKDIPLLYFSDVGGRYGTIGGSHVGKLVSEKLESMLKLNHTLSELNNFLENIMSSQSDNPVFGAAIHREIIAQAKCIIVLGGGRFQHQTLHLFAHYHKGEELCYSFRNAECERQYISTVYDDLLP